MTLKIQKSLIQSNFRIRKRLAFPAAKKNYFPYAFDSLLFKTSILGKNAILCYFTIDRVLKTFSVSFGAG